MTIDEFIAKWWGARGGAERSNLHLFIVDLCDALGVPRPQAAEGGRLGTYEFDAAIPGGSFRSAKATGFVDLYKRGHFVLEAKQSQLAAGQAPGLFEPAADAPKAPSGARYDQLMRGARAQAENYAKNLPGDHPPVPFILVCDVGRAFEIEFDYTGNGRGYGFFPDKRSYRIELPDLARPEIAERLRNIWTAPDRENPRLRSAEVTSGIAKRLAQVSQYLEQVNRNRARAEGPALESQMIEETSLFLMRIIFCMFAEDIGLLPKDRFKAFLEDTIENQTRFEQGLHDLWTKMNSKGGGFAWAVDDVVKYFNGGLFESDRTFVISNADRGELYQAAKADWKKVEPAIFGTLLEQALTKAERAKLGAHYTPRPYVERLVQATVMDVLEGEWAAILNPPLPATEGPGVGAERSEASAAAVERDPTGRAPTPGPSLPGRGTRPLNPPPEGEGDHAQHGGGVSPLQPQPTFATGVTPPSGSRLPPPLAGEDQGKTTLTAATAFHTRLARLRILDPACGTGNFLYVAMEALQQLEARVIETIETLGGHATARVGPHQFFGLELNPRAAKIAELVLWIGWLRFRIANDPGDIQDPVLASTANINFGKAGGYDAVLARDETGAFDAAHPLLPAWPEADFIIGNPPFIGGKDLREKLGSAYAEALWKANPRVPASADFVMQWWDRAAHILTTPGTPLIRFGFVTTNSITQEFSRRVIAKYLVKPPLPGREGSGVGAEPPGSAPAATVERAPSGRAPTPSPSLAGRGEDCLSLIYAIPDHPWTKAGEGAAAVRIAMTVAEAGAHPGQFVEVTHEAKLDSDTPEIVLSQTEATIHANLAIGADAGSALPLLANEGLASRGVSLHGGGFLVTLSEAHALGLGRREGLEAHIRPYLNGRDVLQRSRGLYVIDLFGLKETEARQRFPEVYQHLLRTVKPERDANRRATRRENWWLFGELAPAFRDYSAELTRYIATAETSKHRLFQFLDPNILPDNKLVAIGSDDSYILGVLSSNIHVTWAFQAGGWLGVGNDSVYVKSKVFDPFPFPDPTPAQRTAIADLAEELDATRKAALAEVPGLTMTELYNLRDKLRGGVTLAKADQDRAVAARAGIVNRLHDQIDAAVAAAYGWGADWAAGALPPSEIVTRLVALNAARAAEEKAGHIRWLRPDYQAPTDQP